MVVKNKDFDLAHTFECGQCFRWNSDDEGTYIGVVGESVIKVSPKGNDTFDFECNDPTIIEEYFDLKRDYSKIKESLAQTDQILKAAVERGRGIRILKQDPWEVIVSFIISANNNIPRIKKIVESLCFNFGKQITFNEEIYYTFPQAKDVARLSIDDIAVIRSGFRAKYILDAAKKVSEGTVDINAPFKMTTSEAREYLKQICGVGDKVADCILLFAYQKYDVFPKDVWTKRVLNELYGVSEKDFDRFVAEHFGDLAGFAQQYLFYNIRG